MFSQRYNLTFFKRPVQKRIRYSATMHLSMLGTIHTCLMCVTSPLGECEWPHKMAFINKSILVFNYNYDTQPNRVMLLGIAGEWANWSEALHDSNVKSTPKRMKKRCYAIIYAHFLHILCHGELLLFLAKCWCFWIVCFATLKASPNTRKYQKKSWINKKSLA